MARKRTKLAMSAAVAAQLKGQIRTPHGSPDKERMQVVHWAASGQHTLEDLARLAGRARSTIQVRLDDFTGGGLARLLERETLPGKSGPVAEAIVQAQLQAGLKRPDAGALPGRWRPGLRKPTASSGRPSFCITGWEKWAARSGFRVPATSNRTRRPRRRFAPSWSKPSQSLTCPKIGR